MDVSYVWLLTASLMMLHQNQGSAHSVTGPTVAEGPPVQLGHAAHRRERRCSCENQKDKECIFFCHIGIVWVNSPSRVVPYGFGSVRLRRELTRCVCSNTHDNECASFCSVQTEGDEQVKRHRGAFWEKRSQHTLKLQT